MSDEFILDDDLLSLDAKIQPMPDEESAEEITKDTDDETLKSSDLGEFNFEKPSEP